MAAYFEGWYVKQQSDDEVIAFIPALHTAPNGQRTASLQIATPGASYSVPYPSMEIEPGRRALRIGESLFSPSGCTLDVHSGGVTLAGTLAFSQVRPPRYDIMGPFRFAPRMQCRHTVISMAHRVDGAYAQWPPLSFPFRSRLYRGGSRRLLSKALRMDAVLL